MGFLFWDFLRICDGVPWNASFVINFSVVSSTMVFLFVVWMVVLLEINIVFANARPAILLIYWNQNNIARRKQ